MKNKILSIIIIIVLSTILGFAYTASDNLELRLLEADDDVRPLREDLNYNFELVDDIFDDVSLIEFNYLNGVTSAIQTQLNAKQPLDAGLTSLAGLTYVSPSFIKVTATDTYAIRTYAEVKDDLDLVIGTDVLAQQTIGIANDNLVEIDDADAAVDDYCKLTANGIVGRSYAEVKTDLGIDLSLYYLKTEMDSFSELQAIISDKTLVNTTDKLNVFASITEAELYGVLSDVAQFYEPGDKVGDADTLDTHDTSYFQTAITGTDTWVLFFDGANTPAGEADLTYNKTTNTLTTTTFSGALSGNATTASNLSGTPALPNGTTAATQSAADNSTKLATTAYADNAGGAATAWDDIGNPDANDEIDFGAYIIELNVEDLRIGDGGDNYVKHNAGAVTLEGTANIESVDATEFGYLNGVTSDIQTQLSAKLENVVEDTTPELGGEMDAGAHSIGFTLQTDTGTGEKTIDWKLGNKMKFTFGAGNVTFIFTAPTNPCTLMLTLIQDGTGSRTVTWPATVKWPGGIAPTLTITANARDKIALDWDGTQYDGVASLDFR